MGNLVVDALPWLIEGLEDRFAGRVVDRQRDRSIRKVPPCPGQDALGQGKGIVRSDRLVQLKVQVTAPLDAHGGLANHHPRLVAEELGEHPVAVGVPGDLGDRGPLGRPDRPGRRGRWGARLGRWRQAPVQGNRQGTTQDHGGTAHGCSRVIPDDYLSPRKAPFREPPGDVESMAKVNVCNPCAAETPIRPWRRTQPPIEAQFGKHAVVVTPGAEGVVGLPEGVDDWRVPRPPHRRVLYSVRTRRCPACAGTG